jgi:hypothetical protein
MQTIKTAALAAIMAAALSGSAFAQSATRGYFTNDTAARANTADPESAPQMRNLPPARGPLDSAGRANTADPESAPLMRDQPPVRGPLDNAGRANTADPG